MNAINPRPPKDGRIFKVLIIARISTKNQDLRSLDDQTSLCKQKASLILTGYPIEYQVISSQESGERLDRQSLTDAVATLERGDLDLVIGEDLARLSRRQFGTGFIELCEDQNTRFIAINDNIDSSGEWRLSSLFATYQHEQHNLKLSQRLKTRLRERFTSGGALACPIYGYRKKLGATSDADLEKIPEAQPVYDQIFEKLENGASYSEVADFLNDSGIKPGAHCRLKKWDCRMVARLVLNPIVKGVRIRNRKESKRINKTGVHQSVNAPRHMLLERRCPHLEFIDPERFDRLGAMLKEKNATCARGRLAKLRDSRKGISKKSTIWPGQHLRCGICNRIFYWGGHGAKNRMMCAGCRDYRCWNSVSIDGAQASKLLTASIFREIESLSDFDAVFLESVNKALARRRDGRGGELAALNADIKSLEAKIERVTDAISNSPKSEALFSKLDSLEGELRGKRLRRDQIQREPTESLTIPSMDQIRVSARDKIAHLAEDSPEFGRIMTRLIPSLKVFPYRCCDGGTVVLRAVVKLDLTPLLNFPGLTPETSSFFQKEFVVDLFRATQRVKFRERIKEMRAEGMSERAIAMKLGLTITATQSASKLTRLMDSLGLSDPYIKVSLPLADEKRTRHLHKRFKFEPLTEDPID